MVSSNRNNGKEIVLQYFRKSTGKFDYLLVNIQEIQLAGTEKINHYALKIHRFKTRMKFDKDLDGSPKTED